MRFFRSLLTLALLALAPMPCLGDEPESGKLDTEPGLRLRIFHIGEDFDLSRPLQPGQSPNVDSSVERVRVEAGTTFADIQEISDRAHEKITSQYIAEWTGWIKAPSKGSYQFFINTPAPANLRIGDQPVEGDSIELNEGWHILRLVQKVVNAEQQAITLTWKKPGDRKLKAYNFVEAGFLRAPKRSRRSTG